jgi:hypothetical protein
MFSQAELDQMSAEAEARKPPDPSLELYRTADRMLSVNSSMHNGIFLATFVGIEGEKLTFPLNPAAAWRAALTLSQLMELASWMPMVPGASLDASRKRNSRKEITMEETYERFLPAPPSSAHLAICPMIVAVSGGAGSEGAVLSFRLENNNVVTLFLNQIVAYRLFAMLAAVIESCEWIGPDRSLRPRESN